MPMTIKKWLCCGCGACVGICLNNAIELKINRNGFYIPEIDKKLCVSCGMCSNVCPQINRRETIIELNNFIFGKQPIYIIGNYTNCYVGYSMNKNLRFEASSGGMVTQILISALEEGIISGAIVTRMKNDNPLIPEVFIARTKEEVISAMGSKYCPVPVNILLKEVIKSKDDERFAIVGLPCHIIGIRKAEMLIPKLKEKIVLHCGLFCGATRSFLATEYLLKKNNIKKEEVIFIKYRGKGWPGYLQIKKRTSFKNVFLLSYYYYGGLFGMFFKNKACLSCNDYSNEFADISFGDAWNLEKEDSIGTSVIITRTKNSDNLLNKFYFEKKIFINEISIENFISSKETIIFKKKLPIKNIRIFYINTWLSEALYSIPLLNLLSIHPNRILRYLFLEAFDSIILIMRRVGQVIRWIIKNK